METVVLKWLLVLLAALLAEPQRSASHRAVRSVPALCPAHRMGELPCCAAAVGRAHGPALGRHGSVLLSLLSAVPAELHSSSAQGQSCTVGQTAPAGPGAALPQCVGSQKCRRLTCVISHNLCNSRWAAFRAPS